MIRLFRLAALAAFLATVPQAPSQVIISEFMADNKKTLADEDGEFSDWIELYNTNATSVNLAGWALTDDPDRQERWLLPSTNLPPQGLLVVFASGKNRATPGRQLHTDFSLRASGEYLALLRPNSTPVTEFAPATPEQFAGFSYGLAQNVTTNVLLAAAAPARYVVPNASTPVTWKNAGFDDSTWTSATSALGYETAVPGFAVYNYLATVPVCSLPDALSVITQPAQQAQVFSANTAVINFFNSGGQGNFGDDTDFPGLTMAVDTENFAVRATATVTIPTAGDWTFGVSSDDGFRLNVGPHSMAYPDPRGPGDTLQTFRFTQAGDYELELVFYECGGGSEVELFAAQGRHDYFDGSSFRLVGAADGLAVRSPVVAGGASSGSYRAHFKTDVQSAMLTTRASIYVRVPFQVLNPAALQSLTLMLKYDDGFVAYLNGTEVARRNAPGSIQWNSTATAEHPAREAVTYEHLNISENLGALVTGQNVLAIQGLNVSANDADFLLSSAAAEFRALGQTYMYFGTPTPGTLNGAGSLAFVADTKFSVDRGFFEQPFSLEITSETPGATIIYTTNGTVPALTNGTVYTGPVAISRTTVLRAAAFKEGFYPSDADTQTYLFVSDVIRQSPNGQAPPGWPSNWGQNTVDYGMDPEIVDSTTYRNEITNSLKSLPSFSIVTDLKNLFDPSTGIYANPGQDGAAWERPISLELIHPDGKKGFQANAGLRIRGGYSRSPGNPKHAFRLFFRTAYGDSRLDYPVFEKQNGTDSYDSFDLRTFQNYSWSFEGDPRFTGVRDQFSRDVQLAMGQQAERGDYCHLYINGQYWGIYNTAERPEADYAESYFGGSEEDYDVVKVETTAGYTIQATDGNLDAWNRLWRAGTNGFASNADYFKVQGRNADGTLNPAYEELLDIQNLVDYMLIIIWSGNLDAPISNFLGNESPNNYYAIRNRTGAFGGFRFFAHDSEHTLLTDQLNTDRTGPFAAGDPRRQGGGAFSKSNPQYLFSRLSENAEFRFLVADRIQKLWFNNGLLSTAGSRQLLTVRSNELHTAILAESARWGDSKTHPPRTRNADWASQMRAINSTYLGQRPNIALNQLRAKSLYPTVTAPAFNQFGGNVPEGFSVSMSGGTTIYYTTDGTDPRLLGGSVAPTAVRYEGPLPLTQSIHVKARAREGSTWSALTEATFYVTRDFTGLLMTEIMYNPLPSATAPSGDYEFLELKNITSETLELSGLRFTNGIQYTFPLGSSVAPGQFVVLARNAAAFSGRYPEVRIDGIYTNGLSSSGETLTLVHNDGKPLLKVTYANTPPWPAAANGLGFSLVPLNPNSNPDPSNPVHWRASSLVGGSPGADDAPLNIARVVINEILTHTDLPQVDWVELYNPHGTNVDAGGWFLSDDPSLPNKVKIPAGKIIPANGYLVVTETEWNAAASSENQFRLSSHGDELYLSSADANGTLTGYMDTVVFGAAKNGVSFGRHVNSAGDIHYPAQSTLTPGAVNSGPGIGTLIINEIHYNPGIGGDEFIELKSNMKSTLKLYDPLFPTNTWRVNGVGLSFPQGTEIEASGLLLIVGSDPATFRTRYGVPAGVQIFGPWSGTLQDSGEELAVQFPDQPDTEDGEVYVPYINLDVVRYNDKEPWPTNTDGGGASLERLVANAYGNEPSNWRASPGAPSPGFENSGNRPPLVNAGSDQSIELASTPVTVTLAGTASDDGLPENRLVAEWTQVSGPAPAWFADQAALSTSVYLPGAGGYVFRLRVSDGEREMADEVSVNLQHTGATTSGVLAPKRSTWKYLDTGANLPVLWRSGSYNDSGWAAGPAPLGYSDANGEMPATTVSYGPNPDSKFVTTYFRRSFELSNPGSFKTLNVSLQRDDGAVVYLNGTPIMTNNMPTGGAIDYLTFASTAVGSVDEVTFYDQAVDPSLLVFGKNVLAVEIHQAAWTSTDIIFDLELSGTVDITNRPPGVNAGPDQDLPSTGAVSLSGVVTDDALPSPPALLRLEWTKVSGPGEVTFEQATSPVTTASFSAAGTYVLRLAADDGGAAASDELTIRVGAVEPVILSASVIAENGTVALQFEAAAGKAYTVQFADSVPSKNWSTLAAVAAGASRNVMVTDTNTTAQARFYRVRTE